MDTKVRESVEPSTELEAVVRRAFAAWNAREVETFLNLCADERGMLFIGSDPNEWWAGPATVRRIVEAQIREFDEIGATFDLGEIEAFTEGTVGWVACQLTLLLSSDARVAMRYTAVLHLDRGVWRFVQSHASLGVENEESLGTELTTTIEHLAALVRDERPDLGAWAGHDGTVTMLFSDIERSTDLTARLGDQKWVELLHRHEALVARCAAREGGRVVKSLGDGHMLAFPSARRALRSSIEIQRALQDSRDGETLRLRIGIHTGEVIRHADDFFGNAVNMAARVVAAADGNEILVSTLVNELTRNLGIFQFGESRTVHLKGIPGEQRLFPLVWRDAS